jgi:hypothetical protein
MVKVVFNRKEYDGSCEICRHFQKKLDNPRQYPRTVLIVCSLDRRSLGRLCPLMQGFEVALGFEGVGA